MHDLLLAGLKTLNELLTAGIAITAFSLLLYVLTFNLHDRVTRSFAIILLCVTAIFVAETLSSVAASPSLVEFWLLLEWVGLVFLPAAYLHFSDSLLETTGRPSRGRRRVIVRLAYAVSFFFLLALGMGWLVGPLVITEQAIPHLKPAPLAWIFTILYILAVVIAGINLWRAYQRTVTTTSRRRMTYLMVGALAPALSTFPFLVFSTGPTTQFGLLFWIVVIITNLLMSLLLVVMAYAVAFFGVSWPDRVIKLRLAKWLMRGPITASLVLALTTITRRIGVVFGVEYTSLVPFIMVGSILVLEHLITVTSPIWERLLFRGRERVDVRQLQAFEERFLTATDLQQYLEALLAAVCDRLQVSYAFSASFKPEGLDLFVSIGGDHSFDKERLSIDLINVAVLNGTQSELFLWGDYWLVPLMDRNKPNVELLGLLGILKKPEQVLEKEQEEALSLLTERAALALRDRAQEQQAFNSLEALSPQTDMIQRLRAAARYDSAEVFATPDPELSNLRDGRLSQWVKDALTHYWGGPKLTQSPLIQLQIVQIAAKVNEENLTNALRLILRQAIEQTRPEGERRFTADWILYNILEMKFVEGRKVREVATRLAMSEADLYRKQRVAIEAVAKAILEMEEQAREQQLLAVQTQ